MYAYLYLLLAIFGEVIGTTALKASEGFTKPISAVIAIVGYAITLWSLSITLKTIPVGIVYAIWSGLGIISIIIIGIFLFEEKFSLLHFIGTSLILAGVVVLMLLTGTKVQPQDNLIAEQTQLGKNSSSQSNIDKN